MATADLAPDVAAFLDLLAQGPALSFRDMAVADARAAVVQMGALFDEAPDLSIDAEDAIVSLHGRGLGVRCYTPPNATANSAVILFLHGGGWIVGNIESYDSFCRYLATRSGLRVASVEYRLAPETPFPGALDDAAAAALWLLAGDSPFGDVKGLVLAGDSAGGGLAAALALHPDLPANAARGLLLFYPVLDVSARSRSYDSFANGFLLSADDMAYFIESYVPDAAARTDPRCSPLRTPDIAALPPVSLLTCSHDVLRDEGRAFAAACAGAGVAVHHVEAPGHVHGIATLRKAIPSGMPHLAAAIENLGKILI